MCFLPYNCSWAIPIDMKSAMSICCCFPPPALGLDSPPGALDRPSIGLTTRAPEQLALPLSAWSNGTNPILKSWTDAIAAIQKNQVFSFGALNIGGFGMAYLFFFTGNAETALEMGWFPPCWMGLMKQKILGRCFSTSRPPMDYQFIQNPIPIKWFLYWYYLIFRHIHLAELWYLPLKAWGWFPW